MDNNLEFQKLFTRNNLRSTSVVNLPRNLSATPALLTTTDRMGEGFVKKVRSLHPDGYLVGVGAGGIFSLLECYPQEAEPKGIVLVDINPHVVVAAKVMVEELKKASSPDDFYKNFFEQSKSDYQKKVQLILDEEPVLQAGVAEWEGLVGNPMDTITSSLGGYPNISSIVKGKHELLRRLALAGKIVSIYGDFKDPAFIDSVVSLPDFTRATNIIYLTNMPDYSDIRREGLKRFENLRKLDNPEKPPIWITVPMNKSKSMIVSRTLNEVIRLHSYDALEITYP